MSGLSNQDQLILMKTQNSDEPLMIFRAQDKHSIAVLQAYVSACIADPRCDWEFVLSVMGRLKEFRSWQANNKSRVKTPDL